MNVQRASTETFTQERNRRELIILFNKGLQTEKAQVELLSMKSKLAPGYYK